ncbi:hypothetical protein ABBQ32_007285 [Trebouxia sp. C0010 RCD-2024]
MTQTQVHMTRSVTKRLSMRGAKERPSQSESNRTWELTEKSTGPRTTLTDLVHLPSIVNALLQTLALSDLAHLAVCSKACAAVLRPGKIELQINRACELQAFRGLFRLGCLDQLHEAAVCASLGDATAGSYLGILGMCPRLRQLSVHCRAKYKTLEKDEASFTGLVTGLPIHLTRTIHLDVVDVDAATAAANASAAAAAGLPRLLTGKASIRHCIWSWQPTETATLPEKYWQK